ncbi:MAG: hypothetical protein R3F43_00660 [bacterium]
MRRLLQTSSTLARPTRTPTARGRLRRRRGRARAPDAEDVCSRLANPDQADADGGVGDACDGDVDGDGG